MSAGMPGPLSMKFMLATSRCRTEPMVNCRTERVCRTMVGSGTSATAAKAFFSTFSVACTSLPKSPSTSGTLGS